MSNGAGALVECQVRVRMNPFSDVPSLARFFSVPWGVKMSSETVYTLRERSRK